MKKAMLSIAVIFAALAFTSCGDDKEDGDESEKVGGMSVCDCMEMGEEMAEEMKAVDFDEAKTEEIEEKYADKLEECEKMGEEMDREELEKAIKDC